jgi:hypothetical protein
MEKTWQKTRCGVAIGAAGARVAARDRKPRRGVGEQGGDHRGSWMASRPVGGATPPNLPHQGAGSASGGTGATDVVNRLVKAARNFPAFTKS